MPPSCSQQHQEEDTISVQRAHGGMQLDWHCASGSRPRKAIMWLGTTIFSDQSLVGFLGLLPLAPCKRSRIAQVDALRRYLASFSCCWLQNGDTAQHLPFGAAHHQHTSEALRVHQQ